ncbi:hypothetical protein HaLaN_31749, partial [Haematococcus lacustris]
PAAVLLQPQCLYASAILRRGLRHRASIQQRRSNL